MTATITKIEVKDYRKPEYEVSPMFTERWSPRAFLDKAVPTDVLYSVLEAAKWAPSAANWQPWRFIIARSETDREKFHSFINDRNREWCEKAPVIILILSKVTNPDGKANRFHSFDTGAAWANLAMQASMLGLVTHGMGGFDQDKARQLLNIPEDYDIHAVVALGYQGNTEDLPESFQDREKPSERRPLAETVFEGTFESNIK
jgi:nitroreductase